MQCKKSASLLEDPYLKDMWIWLAEADERATTLGMHTLYYDLNYIGVLGIWTGDLGEQYFLSHVGYMLIIFRRGPGI